MICKIVSGSHDGETINIPDRDGIPPASITMMDLNAMPDGMIRYVEHVASGARLKTELYRRKVRVYENGHRSFYYEHQPMNAGNPKENAWQ